MNNKLIIPDDNRVSSTFKISFEEFETGLNKAMQRTKLSFFEVGYWLYYANDRNLLSENGYQNIAEYAYEKYGLSKSTTYDLIKVYRRFRDKDEVSLDPLYSDLNQSQLVALSRMKYTQKDFLSKVKPTDTISDIEKAVKIYNSNNGNQISSRSYNTIKEYIEINERNNEKRQIIYSRHLEKEKADEIKCAIDTVIRKHCGVLKMIQENKVWTSEIRNIYMQIESGYTKLKRAIDNETKGD